jgi:hypothetical protein
MQTMIEVATLGNHLVGLNHAGLHEYIDHKWIRLIRLTTDLNETFWQVETFVDGDGYDQA